MDQHDVQRNLDHASTKHDDQATRGKLPLETNQPVRRDSAARLRNGAARARQQGARRGLCRCSPTTLERCRRGDPRIGRGSDRLSSSLPVDCPSTAHCPQCPLSSRVFAQSRHAWRSSSSAARAALPPTPRTRSTAIRLLRANLTPVRAAHRIRSRSDRPRPSRPSAHALHVNTRARRSSSPGASTSPWSRTTTCRASR